MRKTISDILLKKQNGEKITCLTAYHCLMAEILDSHVDILLVGDSLGMVLHGMDSTLPVSLEMIIFHAQSVMRGSEQALVVVDMPFGTYENSPQQALDNVTKVLSETGAGAVKLEGGVEMAEIVKSLTDAGIAVIGHIGLMPQHVEKMGGYKVQGKDEESVARLIDDAKALEKAGVFAIVIEGVKENAARQIVKTVDVPTIGIGASAACDGQVLVTEDSLGLSKRQPKFVRKYAKLREAIDKAATQFAKDVKSGTFPGEENYY